MLRRSKLPTIVRTITCGLVAVCMAAGNASADDTARPLVANRPIFAIAAPVTRAATKTVGPSVTLPAHRRPPVAPAAKNGTAAGQGATGKAAAASLPISGSTPMHRRALGW